MNEYSIGIDIGEGSVKAVKIERSILGGKIRLVALEEKPYERKTEVRLIVESILKDERFFSGEVNLNLPAYDCYFLNVPMPFSSKKKIRQTLNFEIESRVPFSLSDFRFDYQIYPQPEGKSEVLVAMIPTAEAQFYGELLDLHPGRMKFIDIAGLSSSRLAIKGEKKTSCAFLHFDTHFLYLIFYNHGQFSEIRTFAIREETNLISQLKAAVDIFRVASNVDRDMIFYLDGDGLKNQEMITQLAEALKCQFIVPDLRKVLGVEIEEKLAHRWQPEKFNEPLALAYLGLTGAKEGFRLIHGQRFNFALNVFFTHQRWLLTGIGAILFLFLAEGALDYLVTYTKIKRIENEMRNTYRTLVSDSGPIKSPLKDLKDKIEQKKSLAFQSQLSFPSFIEVTGEISRLVPPDCQFTIEKMDYQPPEINLRGRVKDQPAAEKIRQSLSHSPMFERVGLGLLTGEGGEKIHLTLSLKRRRIL